MKNFFCKVSRILFLIRRISYVYRYILNPYSRVKYSKNDIRKLEIGPGKDKIAGFEALNIFYRRGVDYIANASKKMPFSDNCFDAIYASHVLEHVPWYQVDSTLKEWNRILKPAGEIEILVPNGLKIAKAWVESESNHAGFNIFDHDNWLRFNEHREVSKWFNGRIFSYGDGCGTRGHPNWHLAVFSESSLKAALENSGFENVSLINKQDIKGYDHGWINLGLKANKK